jgi:hypothetical protein
MPEPIFLLFELGVYILAIICLRHAWRESWVHVISLSTGMAYGILLEYAAIDIFHAYRYGNFLIMIARTVPLCIGISWGMIIYTAMETSNRFMLPWYLRPIVDALLALTIDLSMDAIAIRLGFWSWGVAGPWFGVPLGNFYAWFLVVFGFSMLFRLGQLWHLAGQLVFLRDIMVAIVAIPLTVFGLTALIQPSFAQVSEGGTAWLIVGLLFTGSLVFTVRVALRTRRDHPLDLAPLCVPVCFHVFFVGVLFWSGIYRQIPALTGVSVVMLGVGMWLHLWPTWDRLSSMIMQGMPRRE